jgi:glucokinase
MTEPYYLGVDLGGTQLRMAAVDAAGELATEIFSVATGKHFGPAELQARVMALTRKVESRIGARAVAALGLGTAGVVNAGVMSQATNLPLLNDQDIEELIESAVRLPVSVENDANCFALAEARFGAGQGARHICAVSLGTGAGCGIVIDGKVHHGAHGGAGEIWSIPLREHFLEYYLSGVGVARDYKLFGGAEEDADAARVAESARGGDEVALRVWDSFAGDLYFLCETLAAIVDPEVIVIGGSLAQSRDLFDEKLRQKLEKRTLRVAYAELGTSAGVIGAASLNIPWAAAR